MARRLPFRAPTVRTHSLVALAIGAFATTNIDNLFVLLAFVTGARGSKRRVIACQYAGSLALIAVEISFAEMLRSLPHGYVSVLDVLPIGGGLAKAWARFGPHGASQGDAADTARPVQANSSWWTVAGVAIANGSDNIDVYVPLYAGHSRIDCVSISLVFIAMIGIWRAGASGWSVTPCWVRRSGATAPRCCRSSRS